MRPSRLTNDSTALAVGRMKSAGPCARHSSYEGNQSQKSKNLWLTEQTITEQVLMFQRLLAYTAETFAPLTERVFLNVVNGNHDEAQHDQNTYPRQRLGQRHAAAAWSTCCARVIFRT
jgi:hypothetical protein